MVGGSGSHEDQRALDEGGPDEEGGAGQGESEVDVVKEEEGREGPEDVEGEQERPDAEVFLAEARGAEEDCAEEEGADRDEGGGGDDEGGEDERGAGERGEEVLDFG